jgi:hypothetical protein
MAANARWLAVFFNQAGDALSRKISKIDQSIPMVLKPSESRPGKILL